jgi:hypothetical protein
MRKAILALPVLLLVPVGNRADAQDRDLVAKLTPIELGLIVARFDRDYTEVPKVDRAAFGFQVKTEKAVLSLVGPSGENLRIFALPPGKATLEKINAWNRDKLYGKAYLDKSGGIVFEMTLELRGGVTQQNIREWVDTFFINLRQFRAFIKED